VGEAPLSRPLSPRSTPIATTALLHFVVRVGPEGAMELRLASWALEALEAREESATIQA
jgi:hypothetical protein